jgi:hypothetical protein
MSNQVHPVLHDVLIGIGADSVFRGKVRTAEHY